MAPEPGGGHREGLLWEQLFAASIVAAVIPLLVLPCQRLYVRSVIGSGLK